MISNDNFDRNPMTPALEVPEIDYLVSQGKIVLEPPEQYHFLDPSEVKVPDHLIERARRRRAELTGLPYGTEIDSENVQQASLDMRLSGLVNMYGEPCSLLAEHVAIAARRIMESSVDYIDHPPNDPDLGQLTVRHIADGKENAGEFFKFLSIPLSPWQEGYGGRLIRVELASRLNDTRTRRILGWTATRTEIANPGFAYLMAVTRSHVGIPLMGIRIDRERPDCSFITMTDSSLEIEDDTVVVVKRDVQTEDRQEKLVAVRELLDDYYRDFRKTLPRTAGFRRTRYDLKVIGAIQRVNEVLGEPDEKTEDIINFLQDLWHSDETDQEINTTVQESGIPYPALIKVSVSDTDHDTLLVKTSLSLPDAPSFGSQQAFPALRVYPASREPLRFDNIDTDSKTHTQMIKDFYELLAKIDINNSSTTHMPKIPTGQWRPVQK